MFFELLVERRPVSHNWGRPSATLSLRLLEAADEAAGGSQRSWLRRVQKLVYRLHALTLCSAAHESLCLSFPKSLKLGTELS